MAEPLGPAFAAFAGTSRSRAPLYGRLSLALADWSGLDELFGATPPAARRPVALFAAVHYLLLEDPEVPLARFYPNLVAAGTEPAAGAAGGPGPEFIAFCTEHAVALRQLLATRLPQTNEIGRSALFVVALASLFEEVGPLAQLDVGASAGLNLMLDRYSYDFGDRVLGGGSVRLTCGVRGPARSELLPARLPIIDSRLGLDRSPISLGDPDDVRWLKACLWPDQADRFARLSAAVELARGAGVTVRRGDAVDDLDEALDVLGSGHPVVTTSWVLTYLAPEQRAAFLAGIDRRGKATDLSWVCVEEPAATPGLGWPPALEGFSPSVLRVVRWRGGERSEQFLAGCHPHGYWLSWL